MTLKSSSGISLGNMTLLCKAMEPNQIVVVHEMGMSCKDFERSIEIAASQSLTSHRSLPAAMLNMRDLLVHTAAKLEALHTRIGDAKDQYLTQQRQVSQCYTATERKQSDPRPCLTVSIWNSHTCGMWSHVLIQPNVKEIHWITALVLHQISAQY